MKCEFFGCPNDQDIQEVTVGPGTTYKLCPSCFAAEFSMCDQPHQVILDSQVVRDNSGPSTPGSLEKDDQEYFDNHAV